MARAMRKVWVEALTPKQILLFSFLQQALPSVEFYLTTRQYDLNEKLASRLWRKFYIVGRHGGDSPSSKVRQSIYREGALLNIARDEDPDLHLTFASPDSSRVAFGLRLPVVSCNDTPHSSMVSRLVIPLSNDLVVPEPVAMHFQQFRELTRIHVFKGVFEVAWILRFKPDPDALRNYSVEPLEYVFIRPGEQKAYYYKDAEAATLLPLRIAKLVLKRTSLRTIIYPRYSEQYRLFHRELRDYGDRVVFIEKADIFLNLEFFAKFVVTGGATMATESALLGTPALTTFPREIEVHSYLKERGFPIYRRWSASILEELLRKAEDLRRREENILKIREIFQDPISQALVPVIRGYLLN